jgi:hypothetical protein
MGTGTCCEQAVFRLPRVAWGNLREPKGALGSLRLPNMAIMYSVTH